MRPSSAAVAPAPDQRRQKEQFQERPGASRSMLRVQDTILRGVRTSPAVAGRRTILVARTRVVSDASTFPSTKSMSADAATDRVGKNSRRHSGSLLPAAAPPYMEMETPRAASGPTEVVVSDCEHGSSSGSCTSPPVASMSGDLPATA